MTDDRLPTLFNGPLETGVRSVVLLDAVYPGTYDLAHLTWLDHLVVHTADIDGPASLHPDVPQRTGELLVRRRLVEEGLTLMARMHMVVGVHSADGFRYQASEEGTAFADALRSPYGKALKERASWLTKVVSAMSEEELRKLIDSRIGLWKVEFQDQSGAQGSLL